MVRSAPSPGTSLNCLRQLLAEGVPVGVGNEDSVRRQWWAALATLQDDLLLPQASLDGIWLAAPLPALYEPGILQRLQGWVWAPSDLGDLLPAASSLLPGNRGPSANALPSGGFQRLALAEEDGTDPLLLVITPSVQAALCLDGPPQARRLVVRFDPQVLSAALSLINERLQSSDPGAAQALRTALQGLGSLRSDEQLVLRFWPRMAERLAAIAPSVTLQPLIHGGHEAAAKPFSSKAISSELALLEALTHEVRTPLATIRTLIRSLLKRGDLPAIARHRLEQIDGECSEQIDRFGLIFLAAELQRQPGSEEPLERDALARTDLSELLRQLEALWQRQLARRDLVLELQIEPGLPPVLSDPARLETMLGGLIDRFSRSLPSGSTVRLALQPAGAKLKLHLSHDLSPATSSKASPGPRGEPAHQSDPGHHRELVGPVLSWNPATGSLQLSRQATQRLFERLGGRLTERNGSGLTVFFPIC